jgi:hypothetical protein
MCDDLLFLEKQVIPNNILDIHPFEISLSKH